MNTSIKAFVSVVAFGASALFVQAQPALKVGVLDLPKALSGYYKTADEQAKLQQYEQTANKTWETMYAEGRAMADKFKEAQDLISNPLIAEGPKQQAQNEMNRIGQDLQKKEQELQQFRQQALQQLQQGAQSTRQMLVGEIVALASTMAKNKGLNLLLERSVAVIFADDSFDITADVVAELNKNRPAAPATGAAPVPSLLPTTP